MRESSACGTVSFCQLKSDRLVDMPQARFGAAPKRKASFHNLRGDDIMKHMHCVTRPSVTRAQTSLNTILNIVGTVLSSVGALLLTIGPLLSKGK